MKINECHDPQVLSRETALQAIEKALGLVRSVQTLEPTDKDGLEHLLETAVENLRIPRESAK